MCGSVGFQQLLEELVTATENVTAQFGALFNLIAVIKDKSTRTLWALGTYDLLLEHRL